jgi:60 kDa SS-A/Ro ribonucleoprotein
MTNYLKNAFNRKQTPQSLPIPGAGQVPNSAGGYAWAVDDWVRLDRFLILGSEGGSYYAAERALTRENADAVARCIAADGPRAVARIAEISDSGRAPKNDPALLALAMAASLGDEGTRRAAFEALPAVARIGTHLFHFAAYLDGLRGWGRGARGAVARWYAGMPADKLAYQAIKYQSRDGWSHRDLLRLAHPVATGETQNAVFHWITQGWPEVGEAPHPDEALRLIWAFERAKRARSAAEVAGLIRAYRLPREAVPTEWLNDREVWAALLEEMPLTAMIRNLATMTRVGLLAPMSEAAERVAATLADGDRLRSARVHPVAVLSALTTYQSGKGVRGQGQWEPVSRVVDALNEAFYLSFGGVTPAGRRMVLALDVSGSMSMGSIAGVPGLTPRVGSAAMALVTAATEPRHTIVAFTNGEYPSMWSAQGYGSGITPLDISPRQRLDDVVRTVSNLPFGGTDCALPMLWALEHKIKADAFVIYTDSETWAGEIHPSQALRQYRERTGIPARLAVVGMVANHFTIADPNDAGMLDVVGFDTAAPELISSFARGEV